MSALRLACPTTTSACRPSCTAPTTSSAPTSRGRCRSAGRRCSTRGGRSRWLAREGYDRIGILGTSLGSCLSLLTTAHEPLIRARGAESHLAVLRRRGVARPLDASTCAKGWTATSSSISLRDAVEADQPALVSRSAPRSPHAPGVRAIRSDVSGRSVRGSGARVPRARHSARGRGSCAAATTAPARRRSSISMDGCSRDS